MAARKKSPVHTIRDVARLAGTGTTAVSRFFSGKGYLSEATRARIARVVESTGFRLNRNASLLKSRTNRQVALIIGSRDRVRAWTTHFFMGEKFVGVVEEAVAQGWEVLLLPLDPWKAEAAEAELRRQHFAGAILFEPVPEAFMQTLARLRIPHVTSNFEQDPLEPGMQFSGGGKNAAVTDYGSIPELVASYAASKGYGAVAFSPPWHAYVARFAKRVERACAARRLAVESASLGRAFDAASAPRFTERTLLVCEKPDEVRIAHGWVKESRGRLGLLGWNNYPQFSLLDPPVSFLYQDGEAIGRQSVRSLLEWIEAGEMEGKSVYLPVKLEERGMT